MRIPSDMFNALIVANIIVGAIQCFFGYRIFKIILALIGFIIGGTISSSIGFAVSGGEAVVGFVCGIIGGLIGAALASLLYYLGVFLLGTLLGGIVGQILIIITKSSIDPAMLIITAVIGGIIGVVLHKFMIIIATSFVGSWAVVTGISYFTIKNFDPISLSGLFHLRGTVLYAILLCWLALGVMGLFYQYNFIKSEEDRETESKDEIKTTMTEEETEAIRKEMEIRASRIMEGRHI